MISKIDILGLLAAKWYWFVALLAPFYETMFSLMVLIALDFATGLWKVYKTKGAKEITSLGMRRGVSKIIGYLLFVVAGVIAENMVPGNIPFMRGVIGFIGMIELKSISENISAVLGIGLWGYVRRFIDKNTGLKEENKEDA